MNEIYSIIIYNIVYNFDNDISIIEYLQHSN